MYVSMFDIWTVDASIVLALVYLITLYLINGGGGQWEECETSLFHTYNKACLCGLPWVQGVLTTRRVPIVIIHNCH